MKNFLLCLILLCAMALPAHATAPGAGAGLTADQIYTLNHNTGTNYSIGLGDYLAAQEKVDSSGVGKITEAQLLTQSGNVGRSVARVARGLYDFAVNGGSSAAPINLGVQLPDKAIIRQCWIDVITAMASAGGNGTIALNSNSAGDLKAAVDADTLSGIVAGLPTGVAAGMIKMTAARQLTVQIGTEPLTAGKFALFCDYVVSQ